MRPIPFSVPSGDDTVVTQEDLLPFFYNHYHQHKETQVTLILKGDGTLVADQFSQPFRAGDVFIIGSNQPHMFRSSQAHFEQVTKNRVHAFHIFIDAGKIGQLDMFPEMGNIRRFLLNAHHGFQVPSVSSGRAIETIEKIRQATGLSKLLSLLELLQYFSEDITAWRSLSGDLSEYRHTETSGRMQMIYDYTVRHYREHISLEKIAQVCYMTPQAFCKYFKKHSSKTYITFLQETRIQEACKQIIRGEFGSVSALAYACGFNSAINFHKVFKKLVGLAPTEYIRKHRPTPQYCQQPIIGSLWA